MQIMLMNINEVDGKNLISTFFQKEQNSWGWVYLGLRAQFLMIQTAFFIYSWFGVAVTYPCKMNPPSSASMT